MFRFRPRTVLAVLALFVATTLAASVPLPDCAAQAPAEGDAAVLALTGTWSAAAEQAPDDGDGATCTHACHLLQHFQGSVERAPIHGFDRRAASYSLAEVPAPPQLLQEASFRPPRISARTV